MRAEVIGVGTELLLGEIANTNAAHIGRELAAIGIDCFVHTVVGDNEARIADAIAAALQRADAVILTGGLGPTQDDVTREAIARCTGAQLRRDRSIEDALRERFAHLGRPMPESNLRQADVPDGATIIPQTFGTAPGLMVPHGDGVIYALPGVPAEMQDMMSRAVLPDLARRSGRPAQIVTRTIRVAGVTESGVAESLAHVWDDPGGAVTMAFLAGGGEVRVRLTAKADDPARAAALLDDSEARVRASLGVAVVGRDGDTLERVVGMLLRERGWTLGGAESLTGGGLGARITTVAGSSDYFKGSIVAYASSVKRDALGVSQHTLDEHGAVSVQTALEMAAGARRVLSCDVGIALTGVAGPTEQGRPVGTLILAIDGPRGTAHRELRVPGDRATVRALATGAALNMVRLYLLEALS